MMSVKLSEAASLVWASIIAKTWEDDNFRNELMKNPGKVLKTMGFKNFENDGKPVTIKVEKATTGDTSHFDEKANIFTLYLPNPPASAQLLFEGKFTAGMS